MTKTAIISSHFGRHKGGENGETLRDTFLFLFLFVQYCEATGDAAQDSQLVINIKVRARTYIRRRTWAVAVWGSTARRPQQSPRSHRWNKFSRMVRAVEITAFTS